MMRRFTLKPKSKEQIERWQEIAVHGEAIASVMNSPGWSAVEESQQVFLRLRDLTLRTPSVPESARHDAAVEWNALDGFFRELRQRVREGNKAREALAKAQPIQ